MSPKKNAPAIPLTEATALRLIDALEECSSSMSSLESELSECNSLHGLLRLSFSPHGIGEMVTRLVKVLETAPIDVAALDEVATSLHRAARRLEGLER